MTKRGQRTRPTDTFMPTDTDLLFGTVSPNIGVLSASAPHFVLRWCDARAPGASWAQRKSPAERGWSFMQAKGQQRRRNRHHPHGGRPVPQRAFVELGVRLSVD